MQVIMDVKLLWTYPCRITISPRTAVQLAFF
jgi:hypothetical protein